MSTAYKRADRVGELILQNVSETVRQMSDLSSGLITIRSVKLTDDLLDCRIYYSVFGEEEEKNKADEFFKKNAKEIRHCLAEHLNLRRTPALSFIYDSTNESASKVFDILKKIEQEK